MVPVISQLHISDTIKGTTDAATLTVSNVSAGAFVSNGIETITIDTELAKSTITTLTSDKLTKLVVTGDQNLTITNADIACSIVELARDAHGRQMVMIVTQCAHMSRSRSRPERPSGPPIALMYTAHRTL